MDGLGEEEKREKTRKGNEMMRSGLERMDWSPLTNWQQSVTDTVEDVRELFHFDRPLSRFHVIFNKYMLL